MVTYKSPTKLRNRLIWKTSVTKIGLMSEVIKYAIYFLVIMITNMKYITCERGGNVHISLRKGNHVV